MKKIVLLIGCILFLGCAKEIDENTNFKNFTGEYGGKPFKGSVTQVLTGKGFEDMSWDGDGTITLIEASDDSVSVIFLANFGKLGELNFKMRGKVDGLNFRIEEDESASFFRIVNEKISGNSESAAQDMRFDGTMQREQAKMTAQIYFKEASDPFPKGSTLRLNFNTKRKVMINDDGDVSGCQMRVVPIWTPDGLVMGMVPNC
ncbi:hypothetical protein HP439_14995 [Sphingobacterium shayense]|uniref:hypothetical protein n=1 Tax=Sphingobacterium shayense TaxID=626343 RepID=UPI0015546563|nr:hypothetical protein [Sphingobacterium shayense]NQD72031.1 hypothetical protein [Sphingobacterium shayense]